jgi:hypothetical protein
MGEIIIFLYCKQEEKLKENKNVYIYQPVPQ